MRSRCLALFLTLSFAPVGLAHAGGGELRRVAAGRPVRLYHATPSPKGTVLMFHGYTATPGQWAAEAELRFAQGYDVLLPAMLGHSFVDASGKASTARLPRASQAVRYEHFAHAMFNQAAERSHKVHVVGLSVGGAHTLEVVMQEADRRAPDGSPILRSAVAVNPYLGMTPTAFGPLRVDRGSLLSRLDRASLGLLGRVLDRHEYAFELARREQLDPSGIGLRTASYGTIVGIGRFGDHLIARANEIAQQGGLHLPLQILVSDGDPTANPAKGKAVAGRLGAELVRLEGDVHDVVTPVLNSDGKARWQVTNAISQSLEAGEYHRR